MRINLLRIKAVGVISARSVITHMMKPLMTKKISTPARPAVNCTVGSAPFIFATMSQAWKAATIMAAMPRRY